MIVAADETAQLVLMSHKKMSAEDNSYTWVK